MDLVRAISSSSNNVVFAESIFFNCYGVKVFKASAHQVLISRESNWTGMEFRGVGRDMLRLRLGRNKSKL